METLWCVATSKVVRYLNHHLQGRAYPTVSSIILILEVCSKFTAIKVASNHGQCLRRQWHGSQDAPECHIQWRWEHHGIFPSHVSKSKLTTFLQIMTKAKRDIDVDASLRAACVEMG
jgi:hypothetical protein